MILSSASPRTLRITHLRRVCPGHLFLLLGLLLIASTLVPSAGVGAQTDEGGGVVIIPIRGTIEPGIGHFLDRAIGEAEEANATAIILDINTPGGRLDTVLEMRDRILDTEITVVAYVNREAFSAGALITIASDQIWLAPGAVFGAATPIDGATGATASEKTISAVRSVFRATAEEQGRDPEIAEAMVDPVVAIDGLDSATSLLTLTSDQAVAHGYAEGIAANGTVLLQELGFGAVTVTEARMTLWERAVRWVTDPVIASLLILLGLALIVIDGFVGGFGVVAVVGVACLGLFFWGHLLAGLAGWEDFLLIGIGIALIAAEIFVIPGFGVAGITGLLALSGGLVLAMTRREFGDEGFGTEVADALTTLVVTLAATCVVIVLSALLLPRLVPSAVRPARGLQRLTLSETVNRGGRGPYEPGLLARLFGGADTVGRDDQGHTSITPDNGIDRRAHRHSEDQEHIV